MGGDDLPAILKDQEQIEIRMQNYIVQSVCDMLEKRFAMLEVHIKESLNEQFQCINSKCEQAAIASDRNVIDRSPSPQSIASNISDSEGIQNERVSEEVDEKDEQSFVFANETPEQLHNSINIAAKEPDLICPTAEDDFYPVESNHSPTSHDTRENLTQQRSSFLRAHRRTSIFHESEIAAGDEDDGGRHRRIVKNLCDVRRAVYFFFGFTAANPRRNERGFFAIHPTSPFFACASPRPAARAAPRPSRHTELAALRAGRPWRVRPSPSGATPATGPLAPRAADGRRDQRRGAVGRAAWEIMPAFMARPG